MLVSLRHVTYHISSWAGQRQNVLQRKSKILSSYGFEIAANVALREVRL